jgi:hypothetical protein
VPRALDAAALQTLTLDMQCTLHETFARARAALD